MTTTTLLVTGANRGIGLEHVRQALVAGEKAIATCRAPSEAVALQELAEQYPALLRIEPLEVTDAASVDTLAERLSGVAIDTLINNAGFYGGSWASGAHVQTLDGMDYDQWAQIMAINVFAPFRITAKLLPNIHAGTRKMVVMMSSDLGSIANNTQGQSHAYRTSKAALNMLTRGLSIELKAQGITVVSLAPGWTQTDLGGEGAVWPVEESVRGQREVLAKLGPADTGIFIDLTGKIVAW